MIMNVEVPDWESAGSADRSMCSGSVSELREAAAVLRAAGVDSPQVDAELLAAHVLGVPRRRLAGAAFAPGQRDEFRCLVARRAGRVPLQHLTGTAPFRYLELLVGPGVFIPRPETEELVSWGLDALGRAGAGGLVAGRAGAPRSGGVVVDLCAGSGAIALSVAHESGATVYAVERDPTALDWLRRNAAVRAAAGDPEITVVAGDVADPSILAGLEGEVDLVLCNPPYVPEGTPVQPEVGEHDPAVAVFAGPDGLAVIRAAIRCAARLLAPGGRVGIEHDDSHAQAVPALLARDGRFRDARDHLDLAGRPRFTTARMADFTA
jgi:release factor glutamine methyltransferase